MKNIRIVLIVIGCLTYIGLRTAQAASVVLHPSNQGIGVLNVEIVDRTITIDEIWTSSESGFLQFNDVDPQVNYTIVKTITNNSGVAWTRLANELLDPVGQLNDANDPSPQPSFVPLGFSTSNDSDGLSFAQGSTLPRSSNVFTDLFVDEASNERDFLDFFGATLPNGGTASITYGISDLDPTGPNQPFLLSQRPNIVTTILPPSTQPIPEASTLFLMSSGFLGLGLWYRHRKKDL